MMSVLKIQENMPNKNNIRLKNIHKLDNQNSKYFFIRSEKLLNFSRLLNFITKEIP